MGWFYWQRNFLPCRKSKTCSVPRLHRRSSLRIWSLSGYSNGRRRRNQALRSTPLHHFWRHWRDLHQVEEVCSKWNLPFPEPKFQRGGRLDLSRWIHSYDPKSLCRERLHQTYWEVSKLSIATGKARYLLVDCLSSVNPNSSFQRCRQTFRATDRNKSFRREEPGRVEGSAKINGEWPIYIFNIKRVIDGWKNVRWTGNREYTSICWIFTN